MKVTIKDIAKVCGVSPATVSLALTGHDKRVSEKKRREILEAARRLHYTPNRMAVGLATQKSRTIGVILADLRNTHIAEMFTAINEEVQKSGYSTLCHIISGDVEANAYRAVCELLASGVDGIVFSPPAILGDAHKASIQKLEASGIPVVCNADFGLRCMGCDVLFDFAEGGYIATKYLLECGHTRIGCVSGPFSFSVTMDRLGGYRKALAEHGISYQPQLIYESDYSTVGGTHALAYLLGQKVTAIFSFNDEMAFGLYQSARQYGVRIPEDISIIGCDNVPFDNVLSVPLSTIDVPTAKMGHLLASRLIEQIETPERYHMRDVIWYKPNLILRGSIRKLSEKKE